MLVRFEIFFLRNHWKCLHSAHVSSDDAKNSFRVL